ncbi:MAG: SIS domain-containing protein [Actinomycetes bacterium]
MTANQRGQLMAAEIEEQPLALSRLLDRGLEPIRAIADQIREFDPQMVLLCGRGTSDHAALYFKYLLEIKQQIPVGLVSPSTLTSYNAQPKLARVLWVTVSQSGGSPDLVDATAAARSCGALTVAVSNASDSPLAAVAELNVEIMAGPEKAVAATKSYTSQLLALYLLADAWAGGDASVATTLPLFAQQVIDAKGGARIASRYRFVEKIVITARGYAYPTAREGALKLIETCYLSAHPFSSADLMHGPLAMIDHSHPVIAIAPEGIGGELIQPVLDRLADQDADIVVIGSSAHASGAADLIELPVGIPEEISPIVQIIPLQQLAQVMAVARGYDPDAPRGLLKVTETH